MFSLLARCGWAVGLLGLLATSSPAAAQSGPGPAAPVLHTRADTLDAVSALFTMKRNGGRWPLVLALPALRLMAGTQREYDVYSGSWVETPASGGAMVAGLGLAGVGLGFMLVRNSTYSIAKLNEVEATYNTGAKLPAMYTAMLQPKHFAKAAKWREKATRKAARRND